MSRSATPGWQTWWPLSVRAKAVLLATLVVAVALVLAGFALMTLQRRTLRDNIDDALEVRAAQLAALIASGDLPADIPVTDPEIALVQVTDSEGDVVASTTNVSGQPLLFDVPAPASGSIFFDTHDLPVDDEGFRVLATSVESPEGRRALYVAASLEPVAESAESLFAILRVGIPGMIAVVAVGTWLVVGRALRPIEAIRARVQDISLTSLDQRVPEPKARDEVGRLARTMNDLLARLEAAHAREEEFIADAAHELRSPLASLRTQIEVRFAPDQAAGEAEKAELLAEVTRLQTLTDNLLALSTADRRLAEEAVLLDFEDLVLEEARAVVAPAGKTIDASGVAPVAVRGDSQALRRLVRNLLDNGVRHADAVVTLRLEERDGRVHLSVADDGPGIPAADRARVFERFVRLDAARASGGAGLGLAICKSVAEAHGGTIWVEDRPGGGTVFVVELPGAGG